MDKEYKDGFLHGFSLAVSVVGLLVIVLRNFTN